MSNIYRDLPREFCEAFLLDHGFQVYDKEDAATLRDAIEANVDDGTFETSEIEAALDAWERERRR